MSVFEDLGISPELIRSIEEDGWFLPTAIQGECIPYVLGGQDICAAAETGSGKTGAFALPALQIVHEALRNRALTTSGSSAGSIEMKLSLVDKDPFVLISATQMEARCDDGSRWAGVRGTGDVIDGAYQYEVDILGDGLVRCGFSLAAANLELGKDRYGWGYGGSAKKSWNNRFESYGQSFSKGDTIGVCLDRGSKYIEFTKNGISLGEAFRFAKELDRDPMKPHICGKGFHVAVRFRKLLYPKCGFVALGEMDARHSAAGITRNLNTIGKERRKPLCIILEPTRDLANQTFQCIKSFGKYLESPTIQTTLCLGGIDDKPQRRSLQEGTDIVVGTIPKIAQLESQGELDTNSLRMLILDEADDLIKNDERDYIRRLKRRSHNPVQTLFFSATLHSDQVKKAIENLTVKAVWVDLKGKPAIPDTLNAVVYRVKPLKNHAALKGCNLLLPETDGVHRDDRALQNESETVKLLKPQIAVRMADELKMNSCIIFCRTNLDCDLMEKYLNSIGGNRGFAGKVESGKENPYSCVVLAGMLQQEDRMRNLKHFKDGDVRFLICTDVAARGIDIHEVPFLIMMTVPDDIDQWFHRVGRVGRADCMGLAITLASTVKEKVWYHKCNRRGGVGCTDTRLVDNGGCTIMYDEPKLLEALEEKLGFTLAVMNEVNFEVPDIIERGLARGDGEKFGNALTLILQTHTDVKRRIAGDRSLQDAKGSLELYGRQKNDIFGIQVARQLEELTPAAQLLSTMEASLQEFYVTN